MPLTTSSIMSTLRESTSAAHARAERHPLQGALVRGELDASAFALYLVQLRFVHETLEKSLATAGGNEARITKVYRSTHDRTGHIDEDLAHYKCDRADIAPTDATRALCESIEDTTDACPVALLGSLYVLEGSMNGGRYIARALYGAYGLQPGTPGTRALDPYGDDQSKIWGEFRADMDSLTLDEAERESIVGAAHDLFEGLTAIMDSLTEDSDSGA